MLVGSVINQYGTLRGACRRGATLNGKIVDTTLKLKARIQLPASINADVYNGDYEVLPAVDAKELKTKYKLMQDDVTILAIPYYEVSNDQNGFTAIIAEL